MQELTGKLKIVKVEADPNPGLVEKYKVCWQYRRRWYAAHVTVNKYISGTHNLLTLLC